MFGIEHFALFVISGLLLNVTPGQDTFYIVGRSVTQGRRAGVFAVAGIVSGCLVHTLAAAFGLSAILATSARAFGLVKLAGAAYLVYLGIGLLIDRSRLLSRQPHTSSSDDSMWAIFRGGFLSNLLNPKTALFFLSFLPQFVSPAADSRVMAFLILGAVFIFNGTWWCLFLVWSASAMSARLRSSDRASVWLRRATGALFIGLGVKVGLDG